MTEGEGSSNFEWKRNELKSKTEIEVYRGFEIFGAEICQLLHKEFGGHFVSKVGKISDPLRQSRQNLAPAELKVSLRSGFRIIPFAGKNILRVISNFEFSRTNDFSYDKIVIIELSIFDVNYELFFKNEKIKESLIELFFEFAKKIISENEERNIGYRRFVSIRFMDHSRNPFFNKDWSLH